jgi:hypothetical protein
MRRSAPRQTSPARQTRGALRWIPKSTQHRFSATFQATPLHGPAQTATERSALGIAHAYPHIMVRRRVHGLEAITEFA